MNYQFIRILKVHDPEFERLKAFEGALGYVKLKPGQHVSDHCIFYVDTQLREISERECFQLDCVQYELVNKMTKELAFEQNSDVIKNFNEEVKYADD